MKRGDRAELTVRNRERPWVGRLGRKVKRGGREFVELIRDGGMTTIRVPLESIVSVKAIAD